MPFQLGFCATPKIQIHYNVVGWESCQSVSRQVDGSPTPTLTLADVGAGCVGSEGLIRSSNMVSMTTGRLNNFILFSSFERERTDTLDYDDINDIIG